MEAPRAQVDDDGKPDRLLREVAAPSVGSSADGVMAGASAGVMAVASAGARAAS